MQDGETAAVPRYDSQWLQGMRAAYQRTSGLGWAGIRGPLDHTWVVHTLGTVHGEELATFRHEADRDWAVSVHAELPALLERLERLKKVAWCAHLLVETIYEFDHADGEVVDSLSELLAVLGPEWAFREDQPPPRGLGDFFADELLRFYEAENPHDTRGPGSRHADALAMANHLRTFRLLPAPQPPSEFPTPED